MNIFDNAFVSRNPYGLCVKEGTKNNLDT
jgi:hypothetical protein